MVGWFLPIGGAGRRNLIPMLAAPNIPAGGLPTLCVPVEGEHIEFTNQHAHQPNYCRGSCAPRPRTQVGYHSRLAALRGGILNWRELARPHRERQRPSRTHLRGDHLRALHSLTTGGEVSVTCAVFRFRPQFEVLGGRGG